jgi:hypothetical protein
MSTSLIVTTQNDSSSTSKAALFEEATKQLNQNYIPSAPLLGNTPIAEANIVGTKEEVKTEINVTAPIGKKWGLQTTAALNQDLDGEFSESEKKTEVQGLRRWGSSVVGLGLGSTYLEKPERQYVIGSMDFVTPETVTRTSLKQYTNKTAYSAEFSTTETPNASAQLVLDSSHQSTSRTGKVRPLVGPFSPTPIPVFETVSTEKNRALNALATADVRIIHDLRLGIVGGFSSDRELRQSRNKTTPYPTYVYNEKQQTYTYGAYLFLREASSDGNSDNVRASMTWEKGKISHEITSRGLNGPETNLLEKNIDNIKIEIEMIWNKPHSTFKFSMGYDTAILPGVGQYSYGSGTQGTPTGVTGSGGVLNAGGVNMTDVMFAKLSYQYRF